MANGAIFASMVNPLVSEPESSTLDAFNYLANSANLKTVLANIDNNKCSNLPISIKSKNYLVFQYMLLVISKQAMTQFCNSFV